MTDLLSAVERAGVVGCGGAGFPTHAKYNTVAELLLINAAECEPLLGTDRYLVREKAAEICEAAESVRAHLGASEAVIALKKTYRAEIEALSAALLPYPTLRMHLLRSFYPAGDEQTLVFEVTGRTVPPGALPGAVGCVVSNAATLYAVWHALHGRAFTQKYITINGAVSKPCILKTPVGTSFADCLAAAGGSTVRDYIVVSGGPMMGKVFGGEETAELAVSKTTSGFPLLPKDARMAQYAVLNERQTINRARAACIQCSFCTGLCPRRLLGHPLEPHRIMRRISSSDWRGTLPHDSVLQSAALCCECGICELYACPMQLQPRKINALIKQEMRAQNIKPPPFNIDQSLPEFRDERKVPTKRAAARAGVGGYYGEVPMCFAELHPQEVSIALNSHIGAPAEPIVSVGGRVEHGQLIARPPSGALGACYHASISGIITNINNKITIHV
ncbi:MAG: 4Fe-4S dicluster domain-containing protein [Oscillospiraceae bacterium]|jgi:Na+-translocating ferredoxin:NAD+ oxidoreductase RnfC subunit|nr:4Fe-4S dicluster domain-containing protein [Oscillospiraceae bacterium]